MTINKQLGARIRYLRQQKNMTIEDLALEAEIMEIGAMAFRNSELFCQNRSVGVLDKVSDGSLGGDVKDIAENMNRFPLYPQMTLRLCFRLL